MLAFRHNTREGLIVMSMNDGNDIEQEVVKSQARQSIVMLIIGTIVLFLGFILSIAGITGAIELEVGAKDFSGKLKNATPGVIFAILGWMIINASRILYAIHKTDTPEGSITKIGVMHGMKWGDNRSTIQAEKKPNKKYVERVVSKQKANK